MAMFKTKKQRKSCKKTVNGGRPLAKQHPKPLSLLNEKEKESKMSFINSLISLCAKKPNESIKSEKSL